MNLTTLARVKTAIGIDSSVTTDDSQLSQIIAEVSAGMEQSMQRLVEAKSRTEVVPLSWPSLLLMLPAYPVTSVSSVKCSPTQEFSGVTAMTAASDYVLDDAAGVLRLLAQPTYLRREGVGRPLHPTFFQVTFTGGMAADTAAMIAAYPELSAACDAQIRYLWQRRDSLGSNSNTSQGSTSFKDSYDWLPSVARTLAYYRRRSM